jgi:hypothetical protein
VASLALSIFLPITGNVATAAPVLVSCVDLQTKAERISKTGECRVRKEAKKIWYSDLSDSPNAVGESLKELTICSNRASAKFTYRVIKSNCAPFQVTTVYERISSVPAQPLIVEAVSTAYDSANLTLASNPSTNRFSPVAFYTVTSSRGEVRKIYSLKDLTLNIQGLESESTHAFTITATSADGTSKVSVPSRPIKTPSYLPPAPKATQTQTPIAAPAFSISLPAETQTVNTSIVGYSVSSSGGTISIFAISPSAPAGTTFDASTGVLAGTPTSTQSATTYTITATNASGSTTQSFTLTVIAAITDSAISVAAIGGVTAPVTGATPVTAVTTANGYTGTVSWSGSPVSFLAATTYTATITLTAASGYTLTGVTANFFTVSGATTVTHSADSGVVTAVFPATVVGAANKAMIQTQPSGAVNGSIFTTQPVVRVTDSTGNTVTSYSGNVVASKASGVGTLSGTLTVAAIAGVATFTNLVLTGAIGNSFLRFTPTSLTAANADTLTVTIGSPNVAAVTRSVPTFSTSGSAFVIQPQVTIRDIGGNTITTSTSVVTATVSLGGTIVGRDTATAVSGIATFANLGVSGTGGDTYTLTYSVPGITAATESIYVSRAFCDGTSFNCKVGDAGPAGGTIFYVNLSGFKCGPTRNSNCKYLEAAPSGWNTGSDPLRTWAQGTPINYRTTAVANVTSPETATATGIGWGYWNTKAIILQGNTDSATVGAAIADAYTKTVGGITFDDWYLASKDELYQLALSSRFVGMAANTHLSSSEQSASAGYGWATYTNANVLEQNDTKNTPRSVRPIRAF